MTRALRKRALKGTSMRNKVSSLEMNHPMGWWNQKFGF